MAQIAASVTDGPLVNAFLIGRLVEERVATNWSPLDGGGDGTLPPGPSLGVTVDEGRLGAPLLTFGERRQAPERREPSCAVALACKAEGGRCAARAASALLRLEILSSIDCSSLRRSHSGDGTTGPVDHQVQRKLANYSAARLWLTSGAPHSLSTAASVATLSVSSASTGSRGTPASRPTSLCPAFKAAGHVPRLISVSYTRVSR
jgi:hypothetical protein